MIKTTIRDIWKKHARRPFQVAAVAGVLTAIYTLSMPNYYKSEARILPVDGKGMGNMGGLAAAAAAFGVGVPGGDGGDANYVDILKSRTMAEAILNKEFEFEVRTWRFGKPKKRKETLYAYLKAENTDRAVRAFSAILSASKDLKSKVLTVSAETKSPELSQQIVRLASTELEKFVQERGRTKGSEKAAFAEARLKEARVKMTEAEDDFRRFLEVNRNYQSSAEPAIRLKGARLEGEFKLKQMLVTTLSQNLEQSLMEEKNDMPILNKLDEGNLPIDKSKPARSIIVLLVSFLFASGTWAWLNREWIKEKLLEEDASSPECNQIGGAK